MGCFTHAFGFSHIAFLFISSLTYLIVINGTQNFVKHEQTIIENKNIDEYKSCFYI